MGTGTCPACGLSFDGPEAPELFRLLSEADALLARMRARSRVAAAEPPAGTAYAPEAPSRDRVDLLAPPDPSGSIPPPVPGMAPAPARTGPRLPSATVPAVLLGLGAVLLSVAVLVFAAFTWFLLPEVGRALLLLGLAGGAAVGAWDVSRRGLRIAAEALWPLSAFVAVVGLQLLGPGSGDAGAAWTFVTGLALVSAGILVARRLQGRSLPVPVLLETAVILLATVAAAGLTDLDPQLPLVGAGSTLCILALALVLAAVAVSTGLRIVAGIALAAAALAWLALVSIGAARVVDGGFPASSPARYADLVIAIAIAAGLAYAPLARLGSGVRADLAAAAPWARRAGAGAAGVVTVMLGALATAGDSSAGRVPELHLNAAALVVSALLLMISTVVAVGRPAEQAGEAGIRRRHRLEGLTGAWVVVAAGSLFAAAATAASTLESLDETSQGDLGGVDPLYLPSEPSWWWALAILAAVVAVTLPRVFPGSDPVSTWARRLDREIAPTALLVLTALCAVGPRGPLWATAAVLAAAVLTAAVMAWADRGLVPFLVLAAAAALLVVAAASSLELRAASLALIAAIAVAMTLRPTDGEDAGAEKLTATATATAAPAVTAAVAPLAAAAAVVDALRLADLSSFTSGLVSIGLGGAWLVLLTVLRRSVEVRSPAGVAGLVIVLVAVVDKPASEVSWLLLAGGLAAVLATVLAPDEDAPTWIGGGLLLGATVARTVAGGAPPETISVSAGAVLIALGAWQLHRRPQASSLRLLGPALSLTFAPTLLLALDEPAGVRTLVLVALATAALAWGALAGLAAPLVAGAASLLLLALRLLGPVATTLPWWLVAGALGTVLLVVGATWESRRAEIDAAVRYVRRLR